MSEDIIELSIEETNKLRAELGLVPLRLSPNQQRPLSSPAEPKNSKEEEEVLELSVDDTNALRERLGLAPLRTTTTKKANEVYKPAENDRDAQEIADRIAQARLKREVEAGAIETFGNSTLATAEVTTEEKEQGSTLSWAEQMRRQTTTAIPTTSTVSKTQTSTDTKYDETDLEGLHVAHDFNDLESGETTILTLADAPLLSESLDHATSKKIVGLQEEDVAALENVTLAERKKQQNGLRKKRLLELGMGRAGGYAGFDDDEFEELGGVLGPSKGGRRGNPLLEENDGENTSLRGFRIGASTVADSSITDLDKIQQGKAISLVPDKADVVASDYMTVEEEEAERATRKKKKDEQFKKKKKKKDKKRRKTQIDSDEEEGQDDGDLPTSNPLPNGKNKVNVLEQLQESALPTSSGLRKRRRVDDDDQDEQGTSTTDKGFVAVKEDPARPAVPGNNNTNNNKRAKYDEIMAKGNERTKLAFAEKKAKRTENSGMDEEPDDSFLNAALAKARRLNRLREMNQTVNGADAVAEAVRSRVKDPVETTGGVAFTIDDTREFTLALQARAQQKEREVEKAKQQQRSATTKANQVVKREEEPSLDKKDEVETIDEEEDVDMEVLAKEVKTDDFDDTGLDGSTARSAGVGRGLSSFVSLLKTTGEISSKKAKEELKGRAKDEKNYENYAPMDLSKVVKIGRNATDKDRELAGREIKLEYRDKHGRLLTTKEAFRDLCYQFHGYGASKKKEEKRLKQMEREQAQGRMASRQVAAARDGTAAGTLGALKATQKATGKAFIVHKT